MSMHKAQAGSPAVHARSDSHLHLLPQVLIGGKRIALLSAGDCFGEAVLYHDNNKRTASVITRTYCQLFSLSKTAMNVAYAAHPTAYAELRARARSMFQKHIASRAASTHIGSDSEHANASHFVPAVGEVSVEAMTRKSVGGAAPEMGSQMCAPLSLPACSAHAPAVSRVRRMLTQVTT